MNPRGGKVTEDEALTRAIVALPCARLLHSPAVARRDPPARPTVGSRLGTCPPLDYKGCTCHLTNRHRPGLREALAACRAGDTLVVTKLDRLAWSLPDARAIADELTVGRSS